MVKKGIDVSEWNGKIDFEKLNPDEVQFIMLRAGGWKYKDKQFERNYIEAKKHKIPIGAYFFTGPNFATSEQGKIEAEYFISLLDNKSFEYPVVADVEAVSIKKGKRNITNATNAFCKTLEQSGYYPMIYGSEISVFRNRLSQDQLNYDFWVANWTGQFPQMPYTMFQYGDRGDIRGIKGFVDLNFCYKDYPSLIKAEKKNNLYYKTYKEIAQEVISGKWGNGVPRKEAIEQAGYDYKTVQMMVNSLIYNTHKTLNEKIADEVILGKWGNGAARKAKLTAAGYDYIAIQKIVNEKMGGKKWKRRN